MMLFRLKNARLRCERSSGRTRTCSRASSPQVTSRAIQKGQTQQAHGKDTGIHGRVIEERTALQSNGIAQAALGGERLGNVQHHHGGPDRLAQGGEDGWQAGRQVNVAE